MDESKLTLDLPNLTLEAEGRSHPLSSQLFKVVYQFFKAAARGQNGQLLPVVKYADFPMTQGAIKVHMVDLKKLLPEGSYENVRGEGYRPSSAWKWVLIS